MADVEMADEDDLEVSAYMFKGWETCGLTITKAAFAPSISKGSKTKYRDEEFYMSHFQKDAMTEKG